MKGLIQVYTGDGKGKTTAAIGLACRARGQGLRVCFISFHKPFKEWASANDQRMLQKIGVEVKRFAEKHPACPFWKEKITPDSVRKECLEGLKFIKKIYQENKYDLLVLDEINISLRDGFLKEEEVLDILNSKPKNLELVLTGRGATKGIIEKGDLVSEIKKIKHPYDLGVKRRKGIEY